MSNRITKKELNRRVAERLMKGQGTTGEIIDATLEEIYAALKNGESVSLHNFGTQKRDILEFAGIGAELYDGTDAQEYVDQLRSRAIAKSGLNHLASGLFVTID